jgi:hypothetical protein
MNRDEWIEQFATAIGTEAPDAATVEELLELAAVAAHASERTAAPIACYLAGRDGRRISELKSLADEVGNGD